MAFIKFYELTYNSDCNEGRGHTVVAARFADRESAVLVCEDPRFYKKHGVWGGKMNPEYDIREVSGPLFETADEYWAYDVDEVKRNALAKLTDAEKKALGLSL